MVKTFAVNENNDLYIDSNGNLAITSDLEAVLQVCAQAAKTQLGEMPLAINQGLPNFETIWRGSPNTPQFEAALRRAITSVAGVKSITDLLIEIINNTLFYRITILTQYGEGIING